MRFTLVLALALLLSGSEGKKGGGGRRLKKELKKELKKAPSWKDSASGDGGNSLGSWTAATEPMHKTVCGDHACRPGEGNLKGYTHWSQPYEHKDTDKSISKYAPDWNGNMFPSERYQPIVTLAASKARDGLIIFAAADFDYRENVLNWYRLANNAGVGNAIVHSLDDEALVFFEANGVPASNGTASMDAWRRSRLSRHIQRALAERHMAAAALVNAGLNVLMMDATAVLVRDPRPFLSTLPPAVDVAAMRGGCRPSKQQVGCEPMWNFLVLRGAGAAQRARVLTYIQAALNKGLVDFYLRWWMGHHCIEMGYNKLFTELRATLQGGLTAAAVAAQTSETALVSLGGKHKGLTLALLPRDTFPNAFEYLKHKATAFVGRVVRPEKDPKRTHRLRLDRYDEIDFDDMRSAMIKDGLWALPEHKRV